MAMVRGAPASSIGSVSARCNGVKDLRTSDRAAIRSANSTAEGEDDRKKLDAANAMERPKTIWMRRRAPPELSPKASVSPVIMMIITATIFATGPSMDSRIAWSGASHGMFEPAA